MFLRTAFASLIVSAALVSGCALNSRSIAEIQHFPGRYQDRSVSIEGTVTSSFGGPLLPVQYYKVDDGTGEMIVISNGAHGMPHKGARVKVHGHVEEVASLGNRSFGLHLREDDLDVKRR